MADVFKSQPTKVKEALWVFFTGFNDFLEQLDSDADNLVTEYLERKLEFGALSLFALRFLRVFWIIEIIR